MANYRVHIREQIEMKFMCINDFVPNNHKARKIVFICEKLDLFAFDDYFENDEGGNKAYPVKDLLAILIYAFLEGVYSLRKIENECKDNIIYRYLCCDDIPDHSTISRFWNRFKTEIEDILVQTVYIADSKGLTDYEHISGDGVKIGSMGSRSMLFNEKSAKKRLDNIEKYMAKLIEKIDQCSDNEEKEKLKKKKNQKETLKDRIEEGMIELKYIQEKIKKEKASGSKIENTNYQHLTEKDARLVKKKGGFISGYNNQALVDSKNNIIITSDVTTNTSDYNNGKSLMNKAFSAINKKKLQEGKITFDNGYLQDDFIKFGIDNKIDLYIAAPKPGKIDEEKLKKRKSCVKDLRYNEKKDVYICTGKNKELVFKRIQWTKGRAYARYERNCGNCKLGDICMPNSKRKRREKTRRIFSKDRPEEMKKNRSQLYDFMKEKMSKEKSKEIYSRRLPNVEPVFAHIEERRGFRRFSVWGKDKAKGQWAFVCAVHNLYKIMKYSNYGVNYS